MRILENSLWKSFGNEPLDGAHLWEIRPSLKHPLCLNKREFERYEGIKNEESKQNFSTSCGGLRKVLSMYLNSEPSRVPLLRKNRGKPYVENGPDFNLSNTAGRTLVAFFSSEVGLDIERRDRRVSATQLAGKFFHPDEIRRLAAVPESEREPLFLRYWVCKEATVKLTGDGIFDGLRDVIVWRGEDGSMSGSYRGRVVHFWEFQTGHGLFGAIASWEKLDVKGFFLI